jgi:hypothetical protein
MCLERYIYLQGELLKKIDHCQKTSKSKQKIAHFGHSARVTSKSAIVILNFKLRIISDHSKTMTSKTL